MKTIIHPYTSKEPMLGVNAFIVETDSQLVVIDTTLTMSDSKNLKKVADNLAKPIAGVIYTHGHPDHIAGTINIVLDNNIPIYALASVKKLMEKTEQIKHKQWSGVFGEEWITKWVYPNKIVSDGQTVSIAGLSFKVFDLGSGGDCDANSIWLLEEEKAAFLGDFIYNNNHTYMADGSILRWLSNLTRFEGLLKNYSNFYIGHGPTCSYDSVSKQKKLSVVLLQ